MGGGKAGAGAVAGSGLRDSGTSWIMEHMHISASNIVCHTTRSSRLILSTPTLS